MASSDSCTKCGGEMIRGRLYTIAPDRTIPDKIFGYVNWEAANEKKFDGLFAYRCSDCGYIEYYAERNPKTKK